MSIPVVWLSFCDENPPRGRWDQNFVEYLLFHGWRPPGGAEFSEREPEGSEGRVIIFPAAHYIEHGDDVAALLEGYLRGCDWSMLFATSDECALFPWDEINLPDTCRLWVQYPRPDKAYPAGTRFLPLGPQSSPRNDQRLIPGYRPIDVYFSGQIFNERRLEMWERLGPMRERDDINVAVEATGGFAQGKDREEYLDDLRDSWITPAPSGPCSQDSFRLYEALDAGCIPIVESKRPGGAEGLWQMVWPLQGPPVALTSSWDLLPALASVLLERRHFFAAERSAKWQQAKRELATEIRTERVATWREPWHLPDDEITVLVLTSPVPSNPDLDMIQTTIASIRERLPEAEILIGCDGVRDEQREDRQANYEIFLHELAMWSNTQRNVCPFIFDEHLHQSGVTRKLLDEVSTPWILFVEHDCPLVGEIDFARVLDGADRGEYSLVRFYHEVEVHPEHAHLFLNHRGEFWETIQWSQRPHLADTGFYRDMLATYFAPDSRTMIEDVMHGIVQAGTYAGRTQAVEAWRRWRLAVFAPEGDIKRSTHLDGRGGDPKYAMLVSYPGERPDGAPPEGWNE